jgi:sugar lactone lactonase YvrE
VTKVWVVLATACAAALGYLLLWPVPIDPVPWTPLRAPDLTGIYAPNDRLAGVTRYEVGPSPEDVAVDSSGRLYCGLDDGRVVRLHDGGQVVETFAAIEGRPLGLDFDDGENLVVCDLYGRLLQILPDGEVRVLVSEVDGVPLGLVNDVDVGADGTVYFSESSTVRTNTTLELLEHRPNGRLLAYNPDVKSTRILLDGLRYANGVAVSPDQSFVLVVETARYQVWRVWLSGPSQGVAEVFVDNLPGFPDGVSSDGEGTFWLALMSPRNALADWALSRPFVREIIARVPESLLPSAPRYGFVLGLDEQGRVHHNLQDPDGGFAGISSVESHEGKLFLGSLLEKAIGVLPAP